MRSRIYVDTRVVVLNHDLLGGKDRVGDEIETSVPLDNEVNRARDRETCHAVELRAGEVEVLGSDIGEVQGQIDH